MDVNKAVARKHEKHSEISIELIAGRGNMRFRDTRTFEFAKESYDELAGIARELTAHGSQYLKKQGALNFDKAFELVKKEILERKWR